MKIALLADGFVGFEITKFLLTNYKKDLSTIICIEKNEIYNFVYSKNVSCVILSSNQDIEDHLKELEIDLGILAWWPKIIPKKLLLLAKLGFINTHNSLLPNNRGKHPYFWAIVEEREYGVTLHWVDEGIDTGDIISQKKIKFDWEDNSETIYNKSINEIIRLFTNSYPDLRNGKIKSIPQPSGGSFHYKNDLDIYSEIKLDKLYKAKDLLNIIRARTSSSINFKPAFFRDGADLYRIKISIEKEKK